MCDAARLLPLTGAIGQFASALPVGNIVSVSIVVTAILLPPVNLVGVALAGMALSRWRPRLGRYVSAGALVALLVLSLPLVSKSLLRTLETELPRTLPEAALQRADLADQGAVGAMPGAIIILSADVSSGGPGGILPRQGVGMLTLDRLHAGTVLAKQLGLPVLVTGGPAAPGQLAIATLMARTMQQDFGFTPAWVEARASDTWENADFSAQMLRAAGIRSAYVVTDGWHMRRSLMAFRHFGFEVIPVASRITPKPKWERDELIPRVSSWVYSYFAFHEWIGCVWYAFRH